MSLRVGSRTRSVVSVSAFPVLLEPPAPRRAARMRRRVISLIGMDPKSGIRCVRRKLWCVSSVLRNSVAAAVG
jgi:hypothetical protein